MSPITENRGVVLTFQDMISQLRQVKGISKKKLKAQEYNMRRKMGICFRCNSTSHTKAECPEEAINHDKNINICTPHAVETGHENKEISLQQIMETCTGNFNEKLIHEHPSLNAQQEINNEINGQEFGNHCQLGITKFQENIQYETINTDVNHDFAIPIEESGMELQEKKKSENMAIDTEKCLYVSYTTTIDEVNIPLVIPRGMDLEKSENLLPKKKESTRKVGRPRIKKSTIGIKQANDALEKGSEVDFKNMSVNPERCLHISSTIIDESYIPLVIPRGIDQENSENLLPNKKEEINSED